MELKEMSEYNKILNQDVLNKELHFNNGLNTWRVFANRGEYGTIENIYKMPDTKIQNNDVDKLKINNINYPEGESEYPLKSIKFNFPVLQDGKEVEEIFLNKQLNVETLIVLRRKSG